MWQLKLTRLTDDGGGGAKERNMRAVWERLSSIFQFNKMQQLEHLGLQTLRFKSCCFLSNTQKTYYVAWLRLRTYNHDLLKQNLSTNRNRPKCAEYSQLLPQVLLTFARILIIGSGSVSMLKMYALYWCMCVFIKYIHKRTHARSPVMLPYAELSCKKHFLRALHVLSIKVQQSFVQFSAFLIYNPLTNKEVGK